MKICLAGGSGFIGQAIARRFVSECDVVVLTRHERSLPAGRTVQWDPAVPEAWADEVRSADVVINLAGENIAGGRWTRARKLRLLESRITSTSSLVSVLANGDKTKGLFVQVSATGFYGSRGDQTLDEHSVRGDGFLSDLAVQWEHAAAAVTGHRRLAVLRLGIVLSSAGGALPRMLLPFRIGLGGTLGNGCQWMSWVDLRDVVRFIEWLVLRAESEGTYAVVAPGPVTNEEFSRQLGWTLNRPVFFRVPKLALRAIFGEAADELFLHSQRVVPSRALEEGFRFDYPTLDLSLAHLLDARMTSQAPDNRP